MKFHQLSDGARFEFEGELYTKSGTMKACHEKSGHLRVIRRSATVSPLEGIQSVKPPRGKTDVKIETVRAALETFYSVCDECLSDAATGGDAESLSATRVKLDAARKKFLSSLS